MRTRKQLALVKFTPFLLVADMNKPCVSVCLCLSLLSLNPVCVYTGWHSFTLLLTYIKGESPFPVFSVTFVLDDVTVGYYHSQSNIYVARGNASAEDDVMDPRYLSSISDNLRVHIRRRLNHLETGNDTDGRVVYQVMSQCEAGDGAGAEAGQMLTRSALGGSTVDELRYSEGEFWYQGRLNYSRLELQPYLELSVWRLESLYYPACVDTLRRYLRKRSSQVKRKVKPRVRLIRGSREVVCLATGFYPRHINLTLLRDGRGVAQEETGGGDLLPNDDGTYRMRRSLEIREGAEPHTYSCSVTHLALDNKLLVELELDHGEAFRSVLPWLMLLLMLVLMLISGGAALMWKRRRAGANNNDYSSASTSEENVERTSASTCEYQEKMELSEQLSLK